MHRAKGLEWDRVYMLSVNNYNFPSVQPNDSYISEKWFVRDKLNLQAEILAQLEALHRDPELFDYAEGLATHQARIEYAAERLRLIYVGITRARKELVITWNSGRKKTATPALPFVALQAYWENKSKSVKVGTTCSNYHEMILVGAGAGKNINIAILNRI